MFSVIKNKLILILAAAVVSLTLASAILYNKYTTQLAETSRYKTNLFEQVNTWETISGEMASSISTSKYTILELKQAAKKDSIELSKKELQLKQAAIDIQDLGIRLKDAIHYNKAVLDTETDSLVTYIEKDSLGIIKALKPIKTANLSITFNVQKDSILVSHSYTAIITSVLDRKVDKLTRKGRKRLFIARWLNPRYTYWSTVKSNDKDAIIKPDIDINFKD